MKVSRRQKVLVYTVTNISAIFFSAVAATRGQLSLQWGITIYLVSAAWINLMFWFAFRTKDKASRLPTEDKAAKPKKVSRKLKVFCYTVLNFSTFSSPRQRPLRDKCRSRGLLRSTWPRLHG